LSYNIQAGVDTQHYRQYLTQSWKHVLPHRERQLNLNRIAHILGEYDLVGLQEVDSGSLRSGFVDQTEYLAHRAGFPHWYKQVNRSLGKFAQHSNGFLSRMRPNSISEHKLPGLPGRGAIFAHFGGSDGLVICIMHLALGKRARMRQVSYIGEQLDAFSHVIVMGDLNCGCDSREMRFLMRRAGLQEPSCEERTFPSWRPLRKIDHILVSESLKIENPRVVDYPLSDHLPIGIDVLIPRKIDLAA
jgi:endonuclease/exonuclease/phosphatase family metal-dependent hydrolase